MGTELTFTESQRFSQKWVWGITLLVLALFIYGAYQEYDEKSLPLLIFSGALILIPIGLIWYIRLDTEIDKNGIKMRFRPFKTKSIQWDNVKSAEVIDYGFVGGWGIRLWTKYGTVYNTSGSKGLWIQEADGGQFLIGTQRAEEMRKIVEAIQQA